MLACCVLREYKVHITKCVSVVYYGYKEMRVCSVLWVYVIHVANTFQLCLTGTRFIYNNNARFSTNISLLIFIIFYICIFNMGIWSSCNKCVPVVYYGYEVHIYYKWQILYQYFISLILNKFYTCIFNNSANLNNDMVYLRMINK